MYGRIFRNRTNRLQFDIRELTSGDVVEVLLLDPDGNPKWLRTSVEFCDGQYYLTETNENPVGLFARTLGIW